MRTSTDIKPRSKIKYFKNTGASGALPQFRVKKMTLFVFSVYGVAMVKKKIYVYNEWPIMITH